MSLSGTLDTLSLPELLTVLAATRRSGELVVRGTDLEGRLWLAHGALVKTDVPGSSDMVGAVTVLLAVGAGEFAFAEAAAAGGSESTPVQAVLCEAQARRAEWLALEAAVPSLAARFRLSAEPTAQTMSVRAHDWPVLVALAGGRDVGRTMAELGLSEVEARRSVRALRDGGLLEPETGPDPRPASPAVPPAAEVAPASTAPEPQPTSPADEPAGPTVPPAHGPPPGPVGNDEPVSRSLLFRYLSGEHS
ncbi:MAG: DUF4388 domain-containing protein [Actinomycetota bacterium]|nr:DUF4388 domain-containing protein [Actinomycetota bacterium]